MSLMICKIYKCIKHVESVIKVSWYVIISINSIFFFENNVMRFTEFVF